MSSKNPLFLTAFLAVAIAGCNQAGDDTDVTAPVGADTADTTAEETMPADAMPGEATPADTMAGTGADTAAQGETLGFIVVVDEHEIAAAEQAREKEVGDDVRAYADMLHEEHTANLEATRELAESSGVQISRTGADLDAQRAKGESELERLGELVGEAYETAFLEAMVKGHTDALATIDDRLMAASAGGPLEQHLTTTRATIAKHLEEARALQGGTE